MTSPYMTTEDVAALLRFTNREEARRYLEAKHVPAKKRGRICLYHRDDVEATLVAKEQSA